MNCVVVDDEALPRKLLEKCIADTPYLNLVGSYSSALDLTPEIKVKKIDLIFLDVQMPDMTGMEFIRSLDTIPQIILVTAKTSYAVEAFEHDVTDYLLKPVTHERFIKASDKAKKIHDAFGDSENKDIIYVKSDSRLLKVDFSKITFIEALGDYVRIHTKQGKYTLLSTMKAMEAKLPKSKFMRVHKSFIIRLDKILKVEKNLIHLENNTIAVSRTYKDALKEKLNIL